MLRNVVIVRDLLFEFLAVVEFGLVFVWLVLWEHNNYKISKGGKKK